MIQMFSRSLFFEHTTCCPGPARRRPTVLLLGQHCLSVVRPRIRLLACEFGRDIGIDQISLHSWISRPGSLSRSKSILRPASRANSSTICSAGALDGPAAGRSAGRGIAAEQDVDFVVRKQSPNRFAKFNQIGGLRRTILASERRVHRFGSLDFARDDFQYLVLERGPVKPRLSLHGSSWISNWATSTAAR